jgi:uncharacterized protein YkwD
MNKILLCFIIILLAAGNVRRSYSQAKKAPVKKPVVTTKTKPPVKTNAAVTKTATVKKPVPIAKKITTPVKPVNKAISTATVPNKPVNNAEITNVTLTSREQQMIDEINHLRTNPARYCTYVEEYLQKHNADEEVKLAAKELLGVLKKLKPLNPLTVNHVMYNDAKQFGLLMAKKNVFEHSSLPYAENLSLGYKDIRDAIVDLLIDEGIPNRGHRNNLLNEKIKHVAVFELPGKIQDIAYCYVQEFK